MKKSTKKKSNYTSPKKRTQHQKQLKSPFSKLGKPFRPSSWKDIYAPNILWACILAGSLERPHYLNLFRKIAISARAHLNEIPSATLCHNYLSTINKDVFRDIFSPLLDDCYAVGHLQSILLVESLPDAMHWKYFFPAVDTNNLDWLPISNGIINTLDHQSQQSTDIRWLKCIFTLICGRLILPDDQSDTIEEFRLYPDKGDMKRVRPTVRAMEISLRYFENDQEKPENIPFIANEKFWDELYHKTPCIMPSTCFPLADNTGDLSTEVSQVISDLINHFFNSIENTGVDARCDSAFGLTIYSLSLLYELSQTPSHLFASGRLVLRTISENYITLAYLGHKDDENIWMRYRNYGYGQTALAFLKNYNNDDAPYYIDIDGLEAIANEDSWMEFRDIDLGSWSAKSIRSISEEAGVKDVYDKYFDWTSGFVHGHWGSVRDANFTTCNNPLHRLHRIPAPLTPLPSVLQDSCALLNRTLDKINQLYPTFKSRINWHKR